MLTPGPDAEILGPKADSVPLTFSSIVIQSIWYSLTLSCAKILVLNQLMMTQAYFFTGGPLKN
jgi:hypothetical protein